MSDKNYFAVIPANVRYSGIPDGAKLLYGEITALSNEKGYCWANNKYFAELYHVTDRTIRSWLNALEKHGFISRSLRTDEENSNRQISIVSQGAEKNFLPPRKIISEGAEKNFHHNNTYNNTNIIINIVEYLNNKLGTKYRATSNKTIKHINAKLSEGYTYEDFITVIDKKVADWKDNDKMSQYLRPETLFGTKFESYLNQQAIKPKPKNSFNNFEQRNDYDFDALEKKLLSGGG